MPSKKKPSKHPAKKRAKSAAAGAVKPRFTLITPLELSFAGAPVFRKTAVLRAAQVRIAKREHDVVTIIRGLEETRNRAKPGDAIVTGDQGERYVIKARDFAKLYEKAPGRPARFISKNRVRALRATRNTALIAPWGEKQRVLKGGFIVQRVGRPRDVYLIEEKAFGLTYAPEAAPAKTNARGART